MKHYELVEKILDHFDFQQVKTVMDALDWRYSITDDMEVSTLRKMARQLLNDLYESNTEGNWSSMATGGFKATKTKIDGNFYELELEFIVTHWSEEFTKDGEEQ